ncbi:hypothetical protein BGX21_004940 [Mortierella sp. AD011]|nr:hypothetical protein BGX20_001092 [Mortierella sp. AD010]KAF9371999.1 hypothetical protein BGX21_004940 [Mortierella sp. AD011]
MLSLIRPSSSPCLHQDSGTLVTPPTALSNTVTNPTSINCKNTTAALPSVFTPTTPSPTTATTTTTTNPINKRPTLNPSLSAPSSNSASYKDLVAQFTAKAPQPYGFIPPRKKRTKGLVRSNSISSVSISTTATTKKTCVPPLSPIETSSNAVELLPTFLRRKDSPDCHNGNAVQSQIIQPLFHSLQSLLPESTSSSTRLGFWANLKAHYFAATTTNFSWSSSGSDSGARNGHKSAAKTSAGPEEFSPPIALRLSNSTPVAAVDATAPRSASLTLTDAFLSLPNLATSPSQGYHGSVNFPVSVAAMDKFKPVRSDTIPLKTFTYHETPVIERPQPLPLPLPLPPRSSLAKKTANTLAPPVPLTKSDANAVESSDKDTSLLDPLPRHLATRETRSNTDYLRMMAPELRMIRARKLVSPLKPRGFLPRRKDPFRREIPREEDDHPLNDVMVGSWSSVSSSDSFFSSSSSEYQSASEGFY